MGQEAGPGVIGTVHGGAPASPSCCSFATVQNPGDQRQSSRWDAACRTRRTIDFAYDPDEDTAERVADEITSLFELSSTDRDICAAALKEWLAKELPDNDSS